MFGQGSAGFGNPASTPFGSGGGFGQPAAAPGGGSLFGGGNQAGGSGFGASGGVFGSGSGQPQQTSSGFGGGAGAFGANTGGSAFGGGAGVGMGAPGGGSLFGSASGSAPAGGGGLFGNAAGGGGGSNLFGSAASAPAGGGNLFGSAAPSTSGGGIFGSSAPAAGGGGMFGTQSTGGGLFGGGGGSAAPAGGGLFGSNATSSIGGAGGSLFGGGAPTQQSSLFGGGALNTSMMSPQGASMMRQGSSLFSPGAPMAIASIPQGQSISVPQYPSYGFNQAESLFGIPDAKDLQYYKVKPSTEITIPATPAPGQTQPTQSAAAGTHQQQQDELYSSLRANRIPAGLREQLEQQQIDINKTEAKLEGLHVERIDDKISKLVSRTKEMEAAVRRLETDLERQRRSVSSLASEVKQSCKEAERGARDARAMMSRGKTSGSSSAMSPPLIPSQFFWDLLVGMEEKAADYDSRAAELLEVLSSSIGGQEGRRKMFAAKLGLPEIIDILTHQHKTFKLLEAEAARVHAEANELRKLYNDRHMREHGTLPQDFDLDEMQERERQKRLLKKVENLRAQHHKQQYASSQQLPGSGTAFGSSSTMQPLGSSAPATAFGAGSSAPQSGLFGGQATSAAGSGLFSPAPSGGGGGGLFGASSATPGGGLFGGPSATPGGFGGGGGSFLSPIPPASAAGGAAFMSPIGLTPQSSGRGGMSKRRQGF